MTLNAQRMTQTCPGCIRRGTRHLSFSAKVSSLHWDHWGKIQMSLAPDPGTSSYNQGAIKAALLKLDLGPRQRKMPRDSIPSLCLESYFVLHWGRTVTLEGGLLSLLQLRVLKLRVAQRSICWRCKEGGMWKAKASHLLRRYWRAKESLRRITFYFNYCIPVPFLLAS